MIISFKDKETERLFYDEKSKKLPVDIHKRASFKLVMLHTALNLESLKKPPSNNLEALKGDRKGQHRIRINQQWRICFIWKDGDALDVEIVDYH